MTSVKSPNSKIHFHFILLHLLDLVSLLGNYTGAKPIFKELPVGYRIYTKLRNSTNSSHVVSLLGLPFTRGFLKRYTE
jgi:hypothetical protein